MPDLKWKVAPKETGRYASFFKRGWPSAQYKGDIPRSAVMLQCGNGYSPRIAQTGLHGPIKVYVADHSKTNDLGVGFEWVLIDSAISLGSAKRIAQTYIENNPQVQPKDTP